ncbi:MAG: hypothetical protein JNL79_09050 [Myxococcales bacterium]|nr:hypothetical protein [Myxococcales bacterium]
MSQNVFALHPRGHDQVVDGPMVDGWLVELGLAGPSRLGPRFAVWLRCGELTAGQIQAAIDRPDGSPLANTFTTRWEPTTTHAEPVVRVGCETATPLCPCGALTTDDWPDLLDRWWHDRHHRWVCACGRTTPVPSLDFQHTLGFARAFVELPHGLAPDLRPTSTLLAELARRSGMPWTWTWVRR